MGITNNNDITDSLVIPVTDDQVSAFSGWVKNIYGTYNGYLGALDAPAIDAYIKTHILPQEMRSLLRASEPYIGAKKGDIHIKRILLNRERILSKIKYMKNELGKLAYPNEAAQIRINSRDEVIRRRQAREEYQARQQQLMAVYVVANRLRFSFPSMPSMPSMTHTIVQKQLSKAEAETYCMDDDCVICLSTHKMTDACTINCGHQFGSICLAKWKNNTCPLCRTTIKEITSFVLKESSVIFDEKVNQDQYLVVV
jgi:galactokinase